MKLQNFFRREPTTDELSGRLQQADARLAVIHSREDELSLAALSDPAALVELATLREQGQATNAEIELLKRGLAALQKRASDEQARKAAEELAARRAVWENAVAAAEAELAMQAHEFDESMRKGRTALSEIQRLTVELVSLDSNLEFNTAAVRHPRRAMIPSAVGRVVRFHFGHDVAHAGEQRATWTSMSDLVGAKGNHNLEVHEDEEELVNG